MKKFNNIGYDAIVKFGMKSYHLVELLKDCGVLNNYTTSWGGYKANKVKNIVSAKKMGIDSWFDYCEDPNTNVDDMANRILAIRGDQWRTYCATKLLKIRASIVDTALFDCLGCTRNTDMDDYSYTNEIGGIKFAIRNTYLSKNYPTFESIEDDIEGFIDTMYRDCTSKSDGSERGHNGELSNRFFIVNGCDERPVDKYIVESSPNDRFNIFKNVVETFNDSNVINATVINNNDGKEYNVKCAILFINKTLYDGIDHTLLEV